MRGFARYLLIGGFAVLAMGLATVAGLTVGAHPVTRPGQVIQYVDRTHKGDRLDLRTRVGIRPAPPVHKPPVKMPVGCDPVFSPLSTSARSNYSRRCLAAFPFAYAMAE